MLLVVFFLSLSCGKLITSSAGLTTAPPTVDETTIDLTVAPPTVDVTIQAPPSVNTSQDVPLAPATGPWLTTPSGNGSFLNDSTELPGTERPKTTSREGHFTACPSAILHYGIFDQFGAKSAIDCAARCMQDPSCVAFNLCPNYNCGQQELCCELGSFRPTSCAELSNDSSCTHYMTTESPKDSKPDVSTLPRPWTKVFTHNTSAIEGSYWDLYTSINNGYDVVVVLEDTSDLESKVVLLDSALISLDSRLITGGAYVWDTDQTGMSYVFYLRVSTDGKVSKLQLSDCELMDSVDTPTVHWFVRENMIVCQTYMAPGFGGNSKVMSYSNSQGHLGYTAYSITITGQVATALGLFIKDFVNTSIDFHFREVNFSSQSERYSTVDFSTGQGYELKTDSSVWNLAITPDFCWELAFAKNGASDPDALSAFYDIIRTGVRFYIELELWNDFHSSTIILSLETERVEVVGVEIPQIVIYTKVGANYSSQRLDWNCFNLYTNGTLIENGYPQNNLFDYRIYAETRNRPYRFSIDIDLIVTQGSFDEAATLLKNGRLPRLNIQRNHDTDEYFDIESGKILANNSIILHSYRSMSSIDGSFDVFTFNVSWCEYTLKKTWMTQSISGHPQKAISMSLFFEE